MKALVRYRADRLVPENLDRLLVEKRKALRPVKKIGWVYAEDVRERGYLIDRWIGQCADPDLPDILLAEMSETQASHVGIRVRLAGRIITRRRHEMCDLLGYCNTPLTWLQPCTRLGRQILFEPKLRREPDCLGYCPQFFVPRILDPTLPKVGHVGPRHNATGCGVYFLPAPGPAVRMRMGR